MMMTCLKAAAVSSSLESKLMKFWTCEGLGVERDSIDVVDAQIDESISFEKGDRLICLRGMMRSWQVIILEMLLIDSDHLRRDLKETLTLRGCMLQPCRED